MYLLYAALGIFVVVHAPLIIDVVFGHEWIGALVPMRYMAATMLVVGINSTSSWIFVTQDRSSEMLKWSGFQTMAVVLSILIGIQYGINGTAFAFMICAFAVSPILYIVIGRKGPVKTSDFIWMIVSHLPLILSFVTVQYVTMLFYQGYDPLLQILFAAMAGMSYAALAFVFPPSRTLILYLLYEIKHKILKKDKKEIMP